ncbi:uncharacterized protein K441DRAFT_28256 [Cenococcum geophilum 1.58]|uniref:uncharacterized protein n=1 Tax=Cenococcum geophilum 1.58 TaxID=794803 RepID=UPI0035900F29|nr:hypothetical protein K441DRAFT_28256 [Cenococcum geophilum 1.58]
MTEVLPAQLPDGQSYFSNSPLRRSSASHSSFVGSPPSYSSSRRSNYTHSEHRSSSLSSSAPSSPRASSTNLSQASSFQSTPASSISPETKLDADDEDDEIAFPGYSDSRSFDRDREFDPPSSPSSYNTVITPSPIDDDAISPTTSSPDPLPVSEDDTAIRHEPSQHVDYLSHEWEEEDIWSSWRHIVSKRRIYGERSRLENASWRTWAKSKYKLKTVTPETLNWLKDCDVTWLYGPLQTASNRSYSHASEPVSRLSKNNSFLNKKPILKKRSMSEVMLQKSISASSLVKQAAAAVQAQQANSKSDRIPDRPILGRAVSDFVTCSIPSRTISRDPTDYFSSRSTSGLQTPDQGERKHIRFDDKVEQCIAVDCKDGEYDDDDNDNWALHDDDDSSDDGVVMMKRSQKKKQLSRNNSRGSFSGESKTIAKLPSTTLKYRTDSPNTPDQPSTHSLGFWRSGRLSPSPSQETLRPANPSTNFLLPEDDDDDDISWEPSGAFNNRRDSVSVTMDRISNKSDEDSGEGSTSLRRTASGMFMPYEEDDDEPGAPGIIGRVVDTVNTARDIAHVIWNVGWRK